MTFRPSSVPADPDSRLQKILRGPSSVRTSRASFFERALLEAWSEAPGRVSRRARNTLTQAQLATIDAVRRRGAAAAAPGELEGFLLHVFHALPEPVLMSTAGGLLWNAAFATHLKREQLWQQQLPPRLRAPVLQRFVLLMEHAGLLASRRVLVPLGHRAWGARVAHIPGGLGSVVYLSRVQAELSDLPPNARIIGLYKASGLAHKEIAPLCGRSKSYVDHVSGQHGPDLRTLRSSLCRGGAR